MNGSDWEGSSDFLYVGEVFANMGAAFADYYIIGDGFIESACQELSAIELGLQSIACDKVRPYLL